MELDSLDKELLSEVLKNISEGELSYGLIEQCNSLINSIDIESEMIFTNLKLEYSKKFSELESFNLSCFDYAKVVQTAGSETDFTRIDMSFLKPSTYMAIAVTASTTEGRKLSVAEEEKVSKLSTEILQLQEQKQTLLNFVEGRMLSIAPNLSALVGTRISAQLIGAAGGLSNLSRIPACNIQVLGYSKESSFGFSRKSSISLHAGFVCNCEVVMNAPVDLQTKAVRMIAAKCAIAARVDALKSFDEGNPDLQGQLLKQEILSKLEKFAEPPPMRKDKPLPVPTEGPKNRRGGRRMRKLKEVYAVTEVRKQQNRIAFGVAENESMVNSSVAGYGMIGTSGGSLRAPKIDTKLNEVVKKSKVIKPMGSILNNPFPNMDTNSQKNPLSGTMSSVSFTAVQGLELYNPEVSQVKSSKPGKYFSEQMSFKKK